MGFLSSSKSFFLGAGFVAGLAGIAGIGCGSRPPVTANEDYSGEMRLRRPDASKVGQGEGVRLSEALKKNLSEETPAGKPEKKREDLLNYLKKSRNSAKTSFYAECEKKFDAAPECAFLKPGWSELFFEDETLVEEGESETALKVSQRGTKTKLPASLRNRHAHVIATIQQNLTKGIVERQEGQVEGDYYRALKRFDSWTPELEELSKRLVRQSCSDPELYVYLGLKAEEYFPNEEMVTRALELYRKSDECESTAGASKYLQLGRFRLGLLSILRNDCKEARPVFQRLARMGVSDYSTRALYWGAYCARSESKKEDFFENFDLLFRTNPLGFHTLSINNGDSVLVENLSSPIDPVVLRRTSQEGHFNLWIRLIEEYDRRGDSGMVRSLLLPARKNPESLLRLEAGVRLYLATFAYRARDMISLFRMLDSVFRTQSEYVVDSTLKLFYPLKHLDRITAHAGRLNPLLIAALIRQESAFQEDARSRVGATGLMQLMPATARLMDRKVTKKDLVRPEVNIRLGIRYFQMLVDRFDGDVELALASYNAGSEVVERWRRRYPTRNRLLFLDLMPYAETRNYVTLIGRNYYWYSKIYGDQVRGPEMSRAGDAEFQGLKSQ